MNMENCMDLYDNEFIYYSVEYLNTISYFFYFVFISINFFIIYYLIFNKQNIIKNINKYFDNYFKTIIPTDEYYNNYEDYEDYEHKESDNISEVDEEDDDNYILDNLNIKTIKKYIDECATIDEMEEILFNMTKYILIPEWFTKNNFEVLLNNDITWEQFYEVIDDNSQEIDILIDSTTKLVEHWINDYHSNLKNKEKSIYVKETRQNLENDENKQKEETQTQTEEEKIIEKFLEQIVEKVSQKLKENKENINLSESKEKDYNEFVKKQEIEYMEIEEK